MTKDASREPDPLEQVLFPMEGRPGDDPLRDKLLERTVRVVRFRRRRKRVGLIAALAACYLVGISTSDFWRGGDRVDQVAHRPDAPPALPDLSTKGPGIKVDDDKSDTSSNEDVTKPVLARKTTRASDLSRRSSRSLLVDRDLAAAVQYGSGALYAAQRKGESAPIDEDNWILMALKVSRNQEINDANNDG